MMFLNIVNNIKNIINLIDIIGLIQGLVFGFLFLYNWKKNKPYLFFGLFILTYSTEIIPSLIENFGFLEVYPNLKYLPLDFIFLTLPFFYIYVHKISVFSHKRINYLILVPGVLDLLIGVLFFFEYSQYDSLKETVEIVLFLLSIPFNVFFALFIIRLVNKHAELVACQYSDNTMTSLKWCKILSIMLLSFLLVIVISIIPVVISGKLMYVFDLIFTVFNVFLIFWMSIKGFEQKTIHSLIPINKGQVLRKNIEINTETKERIKDDFIEINQVIKQKELFKKVNLTILDVSSYVDFHPKRISQVINLHENRNFSSYINSFRVQEAERMLTQTKYDYLSIEGIGIEAGFNSKSAFYKSFKSITKLTPREYRQAKKNSSDS